MTCARTYTPTSSQLKSTSLHLAPLFCSTIIPPSLVPHLLHTCSTLAQPCSTLLHPWSTLGPPLVHPWSTLGPPLVHPWFTLGPPLVHPWSTFGPPLVHPCFTLLHLEKRVDWPLYSYSYHLLNPNERTCELAKTSCHWLKAVNYIHEN